MFPLISPVIQDYRKRLLLPVILLLLCLAGCAAPSQSTPPPSAIPENWRVPVKVTTVPVKPEHPAGEHLAAAKIKEKEEEREVASEDRAMEAYTSRLKKIPPARRTPIKGEKVYPIDLNLRNADLVEAVRVLTETLGLNCTIDPRVKGLVNVRASGKLSQSELLSILEDILNVNNATLIKVENLYKIVPLEKAAARGVPVYRRGEMPPGMRAQVVFLEQTAAPAMVPVLKPLLSAGGDLAEAAHNALILVDTPSNLEKMLELIRLVDSRAMEQASVRLVKVQNTDPTEIINELETIFAAYGSLASKEKGLFGVSFMPVTRLNSVMILATSEALMERASFWVRRLDLRSDMLANVHIYQVENYRAKNLANLLTQVYGGAPAAPTIREAKAGIGIQPGGAAFGTPGGMGGMGAQGGMGGMGGMGGLGATGGQPGTMGSTLGLTGGALGGTGTATAAQGGAGTAAPLTERATPGAQAATGTNPKEGVRIIPDEENNLLVIVAPPHEWNIISRILKQLDIMPRQVLNEVLIAEVTLTDQLQYGLEFLLKARPSAATGPTFTSTAPTTLGAPATTPTTPSVPAQVSGVTILGPASALLSAAQGFTFVAADPGRSITVLVNMLASEGKVKILASPQIMAANNQEARIQIGEDVPTLTSQSVPLVSQATSFSTSTVQYRSTGIILSVTPQINAKGMVTLDIAEEVSDIDLTQVIVTGSPNFTVRSAKTTLTTADNQTVVLGGLIQEQASRTNTGIPGLRRLPILGPLLGSESTSKTRTELLVLITPHIITNMEEGARVTQDLKEKTGLQETLPQQHRAGAPTGGGRQEGGPNY